MTAPRDRVRTAFARPFVSALLAAAVLSILAGVARAQTPEPSPSPGQPREASTVSLLPRNIDPNAPHNGTWFVLTLEPGRSATIAATLANPSDQEVTVALALEGLTFDIDGRPQIAGPDAGVGAWGGFERSEVTLAAGTTQEVSFSVTVPSGTVPGDHLGVAVARTSHTTADADIVTELATRVIVTVPGEADRSFELERVSIERRPGPFPRGAVVRVQVRNTGSIRIAPTITVAGVNASGPDLVVRGSSEEYVAAVPSSPLGGWLALPVVAEDVSGVTRRTEAGTFLTPWWLIVLTAAVVVGALAYRRRGGTSRAVTDLRADVRRLERLVHELHAGEAEDAGTPRFPQGQRDPTQALESALKRTRRAGEQDAFEQLALAFHESGRDALGYLLQALTMEPQRTDELITAAASYGRRALTPTQVRQLPDELREQLEQQLAADARSARDSSGPVAD